MGYTTIQVIPGEKSIELVLNRPEVLNALNIPMLKEIAKALTEEILPAESDILILRGKGKAFCAGADLNERKSGLSLETYLTERVLTLQKIASSLRNTNKLIIAALHGYVIGGGLILSLFADFRVAAEGTIFQLPEIDVGTTILCGGYKLLVETVGLSKAKELLFFGQSFDALEAEKIGLVQKVVNPNQLQSFVSSWVNKLAAKPSITKQLMKQAITATVDYNFDQMIMIEILHAIENHKKIMEGGSDAVRKKAKTCDS
ncbi:enoyl-CoA hydratase/isomerase family protein [candidate division KSB1 bacterium]|nr:MAG: enoyl-CoA hydratase/isomerase family protein [candidate division KSB1 bacterium]